MTQYGKPAKPVQPAAWVAAPPMPAQAGPARAVASVGVPVGGPSNGGPSNGGLPNGGPSKGGKPGKPKSPLWAKSLVVFGAVVMLAGLVGIVGVRYAVKTINDDIHTTNLTGTPEGQAGTDGGKSINGAINMLLIGLDTRVANPTMGSRSDSIIIAHIPPTHDRVYLISIPRDTWVDVPGVGHTKINGAFQAGSAHGGGFAGGTKTLEATIQNLWGITFQGVSIIQFDGFKDIVEKLGGVTMYVDERTISLHHGYETANPSVRAKPFKIHTDGTPGARIPGTTPVIYQKGTQHLSAYDALDFVRCRDFLPYADYDRQRHQQQFIKALLKEAYSQGMSNPTKLSSFLQSISKAFVFDPEKSAVSDWIFTLKGINPDSIVSIKTNDGKFTSAHVPGTSAEAISPESATLLADVKNDNVQAFLDTHKSWIASS